MRCRLAAPLIAAFLTTTVVASPDRASLIARAQVWTATDIPSKDLKRGPRGPGAFEPGETVTCDFVDKDFDGHSRKFACRIGPDDEVKVKFGEGNGEVQGEVLATRLLWALGFGADRMYPVHIVCRGCPDSVVNPAVIERKFRAHEIREGEGWSWSELDLVDEHAGGATLAQRDALKLLAVFMQHTDTKPEQQRLVCLDEGNRSDECAHPFMMVNDVGLTFGRASLGNVNATSSVNLEEWKRTPVWKGPVGCVGNLPKSLSGTLKDPVISDEGRRFLARLLAQLSDAQLRDLFGVAGVASRSPSGLRYSVDDWVQVFKAKRTEIAERRCLDTWLSVAPPGFGTSVNRWLQSHATPGATRAMHIVSFFGYTPVYVAFAVALALGYRWRAGAALLLALVLCALISNAAKSVVSFPRPSVVDAKVEDMDLADTLSAIRSPDPQFGREALQLARETDYGFPSGHVAAATVFFFGLVFFFGWNWAWIGLALWVPTMALSRLYLGRHFLGDVLGGFGVGVIVTSLAVQAFNLRRFSVPEVDPGRAWRIARRMLVLAGALAVASLVLDVPRAYDAGRLLGLALIVFLLVSHSSAADSSALGIRIARVALTALLFPLAWWSVRALHPFVAGVVPALVLLAGTVLIPALSRSSSGRNTARRVRAPRRPRTAVRTPPS